MLHFEPSIRRSSSLWGDIDATKVEAYKKELEAQDQELQTFHWTFTSTLFGSEDTDQEGQRGNRPRDTVLPLLRRASGPHYGASLQQVDVRET